MVDRSENELVGVSVVMRVFLTVGRSESSLVAWSADARADMMAAQREALSVVPSAVWWVP